MLTSGKLLEFCDSFGLDFLDYVKKDLNKIILYSETNPAIDFSDKLKKALYLISDKSKEEKLFFIQQLTNGGKRISNTHTGEFSQCGATLIPQAELTIKKFLNSRKILSEFTINDIILSEIEKFQSGLIESEFAKNNSGNTESHSTFRNSQGQLKKKMIEDSFKPFSFALFLQNVLKSKTKMFTNDENNLISSKKLIDKLNEKLMEITKNEDFSDFYHEDILEPESIKNGMTIKLDYILKLLDSEKFFMKSNVLKSCSPQDLLFLHQDRGDIKSIIELADSTQVVNLDFEKENTPSLSITQLLLNAGVKKYEIWKAMSKNLTPSKITTSFLKSGVSLEDLVLLNLDNGVNSSDICTILLNNKTQLMK